MEDDSFYINFRDTLNGGWAADIDFEHPLWQETLDKYTDFMLTNNGTFNTEDCISAEELSKLVIKKGDRE